MPGETPDYGVLSAAKTIYPVTDLSELAVRLGAIPSIDRTGDVIYYDSFEDGVNKWDYVWAGAAPSLRSSMAEARTGRYSGLLSVGVAAGAYMGIRHRPAAPVFSYLGHECHALLDSNLSTLDVLLALYWAGSLYVGSLRYDYVNERVQVFGPGGVYTTVWEPLPLLAGSHLFHAFKVVIDPLLARYVRCEVNSIALDLSAYDLWTGATALASQLQVNVDVVSNVAAACDVYVDDVIVTQNEVA